MTTPKDETARREAIEKNLLIIETANADINRAALAIDFMVNGAENYGAVSEDTKLDCFAFFFNALNHLSDTISDAQEELRTLMR